MKKSPDDITGERPYFIAEIGNSHDGSLGIAHAFIESCANSGADAVKFQTHIAKFESTINEKFRIKFSQQDTTRYDYWKRLEFTADQWAGLKKHANSVGLDFLSSPFSRQAINLLAKIGVDVWKVSSGEISAPDMLTELAKRKDPLIVSTGMSDYEEINTVVKLLRERDVIFGLLQCTTMYPTPLRYVGLNVIHELRKRHNCIVGLSDHSGSLAPATAAIARGCKLIELHVTFDRNMFGPDQSSSLNFSELRQVKKFSEDLFEMDTNHYDKDEIAVELQNVKSLFGKSLSLLHPQSAGTIITDEMLIFKKPAGGLTNKKLLIGKKLIQDTKEDKLLELTDVQ